MNATTGTITTCGWCKARSHMTAVMREPLREVISDIQYPLIFDCAFMCDACGRLNICTWAGSNQDDGAEPPLTQNYNGYRVLWHPLPAMSKEFADVPNHIGKAATEATLCLSVGAYRAACSLARSVVEATAKDKVDAAGGLQAKIEAMRQAELISTNVMIAAHEIRLLGNDMAHGDFTAEVEEEEAEEIITLMESLLREVYQEPALLERRKTARLAKSTQDQFSS